MTEPAVSEPKAAGRIFDHRRLPAGVVPRHLQQWALVGTALVMVAILAISGPPPAPRPTAPLSPAATAVDPNQQRIEDYQRRIQEQAQRLASEQAQLQLAKEALLTAPSDAVEVPRSAGDIAPPASAPPEPRGDSREERARFVDNVAFRRGSPVSGDAGASAPTPDPALALLAPPSLMAPPSFAGLAGLPGGTPAPAAPAPATPSARETPSAIGGPAVDGRPRYRLFEGTFIDTVLTNRLDGTFDGPVNCLVSVPVYAEDHLVIPAGARVLGEARAVSTFGQSRLAVSFHRVLLPNGEDLNLDQFRGLNQVGDLGLHDQVNRHYGQIFGVSIALGIVGGLAQGRTAVGLEATGVDTYRQGIGTSVAQSSTRVLDRFLNLLPTITIREGHRIKVILSQDLSLPAYTAARATQGGRP
jgi:type IV secretion system protein VirB10